MLPQQQLVQAIDSDVADANAVQRQQDYKKPFHTTSPFEVSLTSFTFQPWTNKNVDLKQWFNYGFNPSTWSSYCVKQVMLLQKESETKR